MSISHLNINTGKFDTEFVALNHNKEQVPSDELLTEIGKTLEAQIFAHVQEILEEMSRVLERAKPTMSMTSTHLTIKNIRRSLRDRQRELN
ncbi:MAG: hypothetical protein F6K22_33250 [Okeania sp. SIO2F4]|uniref:hypothetical protein n=1 Tax=Okeania sp. SIO2F4 TaxID=2607790 RepID=UPI00142CF507|nr:hypothetical protein [Okeania sp. SIO2F4]NES07235.1 hypothetical protein [Okeania sp. SIO2F4]